MILECPQGHHKWDPAMHGPQCPVCRATGAPIQSDRPSPRLSEMIEDAQVKLHTALLTALRTFSQETGLVCPSARWEAHAAIDANGRTVRVVYSQVRSDLATGI